MLELRLPFFAVILTTVGVCVLMILGASRLAPDADIVTYSSFDARDVNDIDIHVYDANRDVTLPLVDSSYWDYALVWSPDGRYAAFTSNREGNDEIYLIDAYGGTLRNLTRHLADDRQPTWSPDGRWLAFASSRAQRVNIFMMLVDTPEIVLQLTDEPLDFSWPAWSPNGDYILAVDGANSGAGLIRAINPVTRQIITVTDQANDWTAQWHPNGRTFVVANMIGRLDLVEWETLKRRTLINGMQTIGQPAWSPDGERLLFRAQQNSPALNIFSSTVTDPTPRLFIGGPEFHLLSPAWRP
jgi:Tol biopolymer transport system component